MIEVGDLVKTKMGWSGPGIVQEVVTEHPRAEESTFASIRYSLKAPHAKVFWCDEKVSEFVSVSKIEVMK